MRPRTASSLVTTRAPIFFARSQSAALLMLASGAIVVTLVPFRLRMLSMVIACSHRVESPPISPRGEQVREPVLLDEGISLSHRREAVSEHLRVTVGLLR